MRNLSLSFIILGLAFTAACSDSHSEAAPVAQAAAPAFQMISVQAVATAVTTRDANTKVLDANRRETFEEHHVPGATWVGHDLTAAHLPSDTSTRLVFYCANEECSASHTAARKAMELGHPNVFVMGAGIQGWIAAGEPVEAVSGPTAVN
ncbi:MAG: rhodanese-like domain-containing protein [Sandaracinaceae bacterium]|nr:rhodanese-like domain-containing protein [Sandaracinaceae bacterium]